MNRSLFAAMLAVVLVPSHAFAGTVTIDFSEFPPDMPSGTTVPQYTVDNYVFSDNVSFPPKVFLVNPNSSLYMGANAVGAVGDAAGGLTVAHADNAPFFAGSLMVGAPAGFAEPGLFARISILVGNQITLIGQFAVSDPVFQSFTINQTVNAIYVGAINTSGGSTFIEATDFVLGNAALVPEPSSLCLLSTGAIAVMTWRLRSGRARRQGLSRQP